jgi:F-type H+-transporting ATPase subunit b
MTSGAAFRRRRKIWGAVMAFISSAYPAEGEQETHQSVGAGEARHEGGFPPFESENFAPQLFWLVVIFGLLYVLMSRIALPRVGSILENREARISGDLAAARELQAKAQAAAAENDENLRQRREEAQAIGREAQQKIARETADRRARAEADAAGKIRAAEERIAGAKAQALANVDEIALDAAASIIEKLAGVKLAKSALAEHRASAPD